MLGDIVGLGDYGLFSASLFKAQLADLPLGLSPPVAAVRVLQWIWALASVIIEEMLALGGPDCFSAWLFLHAVQVPSGAYSPSTQLLAASVSRAFSAVGQMGLLVVEWWSPRTLVRALWAQRGQGRPRAQNVATQTGKFRNQAS